MQSSNLMKFIGGSSNVTAASYIVSKEIAKHVKPFSEGQFIKPAWLECAPVLFENFKEKEKIIQRIKEIPLSRNTVKARILDAHPLSKRKFTELLGDMDSMHVCLLMYNNVRWLSRGKVLQRFVECLDEIIIFLTTEKIIEKYKELFDSQ